MNKRTALLTILILHGNSTIPMNALKEKQKAVAKAPRAMPPQETGDAEVAANFAKWEAEAKNKCKTDDLWKSIASGEGSAIAQWEYVFEQAKPIVGTLRRNIYDQQVREKDANGGEWPERYSKIVTDLQEKHTHYMDKLIDLMPSDLDVSDRGGFESIITSNLKKLTLYGDTTQKYMDLVTEKTKWSKEDIIKKVAAEFDTWAQGQTFKSDEDKRAFQIQKAVETIGVKIEGPNLFASLMGGLTDKTKVLANAYAAKALELMSQNTNKDQKTIEYLQKWLSPK